MPNNIENESNVFVISIIVVIGVIVLFAFFANAVVPFFEKRSHIKMEMERSCNEREYRFWKKKLKNFYISSIPIVGKLLAKYYR